MLFVQYKQDRSAELFHSFNIHIYYNILPQIADSVWAWQSQGNRNQESLFGGLRKEDYDVNLVSC